MKIDAHQHFWQYNDKEYGWLKENNMDSIARDFLPGDLAPNLQNTGMDGSVVVQARQTLEESRWLLQLADEYDFVKGVVGWVDLCSPDVEDQLKEFRDHPKFVGVRHIVHDEPDDNFILREDFQRGIAKLKEFNLTYDILIFARHLENTISFVKNFPDQPFVVDHIAKPDIKNKEQEPWLSGIRELATFPNVYCKLSGMVTEADWSHWSESDFQYYLDEVVNAFGFDRLMIGSDWPVCLVTAEDYSQVMQIVFNYFRNFPEEATEMVFGKNCRQFYGLK